MTMYANWRRYTRLHDALAHDDTCPVCYDQLNKRRTLALHECGRVFHAECVAIQDLCPICREPCRVMWQHHPASKWQLRSEAAFDIAVLTRIIAKKKKIDQLGEDVIMLQGRLRPETLAQVPQYPIISAAPASPLCNCETSQTEIGRAALVSCLFGVVFVLCKQTTFAAGTERELAQSLMLSRVCYAPVGAGVPRLTAFTAGCVGVIAALTWIKLILMVAEGLGDEINFMLFVYMASIDTLVLMSGVEMAHCELGCVSRWPRRI